MKSNRAALVLAARRLFRERGFANVTVGEISAAAGLTHGAFYSHFRTKHEIEALAVESIIDKAATDWRDVVALNPDQTLLALAKNYLSFDHLSPGDVGCAFAALGDELGRSPESVRMAASTALPRQIAVLEELFADGEPDERHRKALAAYASMVGAATITRAILDPDLVDEINGSVIRIILSLQRPDSGAMAHLPHSAASSNDGRGME